MGEEQLTQAFDHVDTHFARMDRQGVSMSVLSLLGTVCWIESQPLEVSVPLCRLVNDGLSKICQEHAGRFTAYAALPLVDISAAAAELDRALGLPGMVGAQMPANGFLTGKAAEKMRPLLEVANRHRAVIFIHHGPLPGDAFPKIAGDTDNARRRNGTLDMQASLSSAMVTLCLTDFLAPYPDATIYLHNLGGNIPFEVERMDHRCLLDTPKEELPSSRFRNSKVYVDCNSFGPRAIEAGVRLYGAERIVCGTDGTEFGVQLDPEGDRGSRDRRGSARGYPAPQCRRDARPRGARAARIGRRSTQPRRGPGFTVAPIKQMRQFKSFDADRRRGFAAGVGAAIAYGLHAAGSRIALAVDGDSRLSAHHTAVSGSRSPVPDQGLQRTLSALTAPQQQNDVLVPHLRGAPRWRGISRTDGGFQLAWRWKRF